MKTTILVVLLFCATAAFCQSSGLVGSVLQSQPVIFEIPSHTQHASAMPLATPQYLSEPAGSTFAHGVKPLWEFGGDHESAPLGDVARQFRQQHLLAKKAVKVFSDQQH